jgi:hypothetical protein
VGILGVGIMNSMAFSLLANSNSKVDGNQISFGTIDFQLHPPTLTPIFASLDQEMDLTIGSLNFRIGSLGLTRLSDSTKLDPSADKVVTIAMTESPVGSSSEVNSPVSFATMEKREEKIKELDELMGNLDIREAMGHLDLDQKDFTTRSGGVSGNMHQVYVITTEGAEENNDDDNLVIDTQGNNPRSNSGKEKEKNIRLCRGVENHHVSNQSRHRGTHKFEEGSLNGILVCPTSAQKRSCEPKKVSLGKVRRAATHQADHIGASTVIHRIPAKKVKGHVPSFQFFRCLITTQGN